MDKNKLYGEPNAEVKAVEEDQALQDETEKASLTSEEQREAIRETIRRRRAAKLGLKGNLLSGQAQTEHSG